MPACIRTRPSARSPGLAFLDTHRGMLRWHIHYNLMILRLISFASDLAWARNARRATPGGRGPLQPAQAPVPAALTAVRAGEDSSGSGLTASGGSEGESNSGGSLAAVPSSIGSLDQEIKVRAGLIGHRLLGSSTQPAAFSVFESPSCLSHTSALLTLCASTGPRGGAAAAVPVQPGRPAGVLPVPAAVHRRPHHVVQLLRVAARARRRGTAPGPPAGAAAAAVAAAGRLLVGATLLGMAKRSEIVAGYSSMPCVWSS